MSEDWFCGPHHYWTHFWCGLVVGAGLGAWIGCHSFHAGWQIMASSIVAALAMAPACGRWGDEAWHRVIRWLGGVW